MKVLANTVADMAGNAVAAASAVFTVDTTAPTVTFAPAHDATAGPATNVTVTFTEAVRNLDNGDITDTNAHLTVELKKSDGTGADLAGSGQVSIDDANKVITIDPAADLAAGDYTVKVLANKVEDGADNAVVAASATFTVDAAAPTVTFAPAHDATAGPATNVTVTFTEAVRNLDNGDITDTNAHLTVELKKSDGTGADLAGSGQVSIDDANKVITIDPAADLAAGDYTVKVLANKVEDGADNAVVAASATFTVDAAAPTVTFSPATGATAGPAVSVTATFTEAIRNLDDTDLDNTNAHRVVELKKSDGTGADLAVANRVAIDADNKVITIDPDGDLAAGSYTVKVLGSTVEDAYGNAVAAASATFTVDAAAPTVTFSPATGATAGPAVSVTATFTEAIRNLDDTDLDDTNAHRVVELKKDGTGPDLAGSGQVSIDDANKVITINPAADLAAGSYTVKVLASRVEDAYGNAVVAASATFTVDAAAPTVTFSPAHGATAGPAVSVTATFTEAIRNLDDTDLDDTNAHRVVELKKDNTGADLAAANQVSINNNKTVITITPDGDLAAGSYTVKLLANTVEDAYGNAVVAASATFTVDASVPTVTFSPAHGATAGPAVSVTATFTEAIRNLDDTDLDDTNAHRVVELKKDGTGADLAVANRVAIDADNKVITIDPDGDLAAGSYTVKVLGSTVEDAYGNAVAAASATFTVDAAAPTVTFSPATGATAGPAVSVTATFTEAIRNLDDTDLDDTNAHRVVELKKDGTGPDLAGSGQVSIDDANKVITINPAADLAAGSYTVKVLASRVEDAYGNAVVAASATFTVDAAAPTVTFSPAHGATAGPATNVTVTFTEAIRNLNDTDLDDANAHLAVELKKSDDTGPDLAGSGQVSININKTVITINPGADLAAGDYTVKVLASMVEDVADNAVATASATFTVDATAPTVTFSPATGATAGPGVRVTATFTKAIRLLSDSPVTDDNAHTVVELKKDGTGADLAAANRVAIDATNKIITIAPDGDLAAGSYTVKVLGSTVEDAYDNAVATASATFTVDAAAPGVTFTPADGTTTGDVDVNVLVQFDEAVRQADGNALTAAAATAALTLVRVGDGNNTDLTTTAAVTVNDAKTVITINPADALESGASYTVMLPANTVADAQGNEQGSEQSATFTVDADAPGVTFVPADGDTVGDVNTDVEVRFNEPVRKANGDPLEDVDAVAAVELKKDGAGADLAGAGRVSIDVQKRVITIDPQNALAPGSYTVTLLANTVEDAQGNEQDSEQSATFTVDADAPGVTFVPADGDTVGAGVNVLVEFDEVIQTAAGSVFGAGAAAGAVELRKDGTGPDLATDATVSLAGHVITINPQNSLAAGRYTVKVLANTVADMAGNAVAAASAVFTVDTTAPTVTFAPVHGATAGPATNVTVTFTEAVRNLDNGDITDTNAHLTVELKKSDGTGADLAVANRVAIDADNKVITIDPDGDLAAGSYTVKVLGSTVEDAYGNAVAAASATFTVDASVPTVIFAPVHGATAGPAVSVTATFTEVIRLRSDAPVTNDNAHTVVELKRDNAGADLAVAGRVAIDAANKIITITPDGDLAAGSYTVKVLANTVEDVADNAVVAASATFTVDAAAPTVTFSPAHGDTAGPAVSVTATFTEVIRLLAMTPSRRQRAYRGGAEEGQRGR